MLIFDADAHISLTEPGAQTAEEYLRKMDRAGIQQALVWLQPPYMREIGEANRYVYESAKRYPDRLVPFGWVDPHFGMKQSMEMLTRCLDDYHMLGIKLNGAQNLFYIDDMELEPILTELERRDSVLALHIGADFYDLTHPFRAGKIAQRHPHLRMLLAHMGGAGIPNLGEVCIEMAALHPNMMLIGSAISYPMVLKAIRKLGVNRVCFGSDAPFALPRVEVAAYRALLEGELSEAETADIMGGNIRSFLRLKD